jgi:hypothetical protein
MMCAVGGCERTQEEGGDGNRTSRASPGELTVRPMLHTWAGRVAVWAGSTRARLQKV